MLKKKTLTETIYNNGDPFQIREAISACIGAWQKREDVDVLWGSLQIHTGYTTTPLYRIVVEAVYDDSME